MYDHHADAGLGVAIAPPHDSARDAGRLHGYDTGTKAQCQCPVLDPVRPTDRLRQAMDNREIGLVHRAEGKGSQLRA